jgi:hypothetical protein
MAQRLQPLCPEAGMRGWFILGISFFFMAALWTLLHSREDEEMFVRLGGRDFRSLPM